MRWSAGLLRRPNAFLFKFTHDGPCRTFPQSSAPLALQVLEEWGMEAPEELTALASSEAAVCNPPRRSGGHLFHACTKETQQHLLYCVPSLYFRLPHTGRWFVAWTGRSGKAEAGRTDYSAGARLHESGQAVLGGGNARALR